MSKRLLALATRYIGLEERKNRKILSDLVDLDVAVIPWCASFINALLEELGIEGSGSNLARSLLKVGTKVKLEDALPGDIVVFKRGNSTWQGHVALFVKGPTNGFIEVLGGNQGDRVCIAKYKARKLLGVRRV